MERKLASIVKIDEIIPIPKADFIEMAKVKGWKLVVKKNEFRAGDTAIYCEIDSYFPCTDEFEFLRKSSYKRMGDKEGFRLRTMKMRGQISQGLLLPVSTIKASSGIVDNLKIGDDVTFFLGIEKYEYPIAPDMIGKIKGGFPSFLEKTDEERAQNMDDKINLLKGSELIGTEKLDGYSTSFYLNENIFGVCMRTAELLDIQGSAFWDMERKYDIEKKLRSLGKNICLQGEMIGPGINGNPYGLEEKRVYFFNAFDISDHRKFHFLELVNVLVDFDLPIIPIIFSQYKMKESEGIDDLLVLANGNSVLNKNVMREGIVMRDASGDISFKVISNEFLLNEE